MKASSLIVAGKDNRFNQTKLPAVCIAEHDSLWRRRRLRSMAKHNDAISGGNRFWPMCDNNTRHMRLLDGVVNTLFELDVQMACCFIKAQ